MKAERDRPTLHISEPRPGEQVVYTPVSGGVLYFAYDITADNTLSRQDDDLVLNDDRGGSVVLSGFFALEELPIFGLPDGTLVPSDFLAASGIDMIID